MNSFGRRNVYGIPDCSINFSVCQCKRIASNLLPVAASIDCFTICLIPDFFASATRFDSCSADLEEG